MINEGVFAFDDGVVDIDVKDGTIEVLVRELYVEGTGDGLRPGWEILMDYVLIHERQLAFDGQRTTSEKAVR